MLGGFSAPEIHWRRQLPARRLPTSQASFLWPASGKFRPDLELSGIEALGSCGDSNYAVMRLGTQGLPTGEASLQMLSLPCSIQPCCCGDPLASQGTSTHRAAGQGVTLKGWILLPANGKLG